MERATGTLMEQEPLTGRVSADIPLISNLTVWENIGIIKQYRENIPKADVKGLVTSYLRRMRLEHVAEKRNPDLGEGERFSAMVLRAAMLNNALILISQPFTLLPADKDAAFIYNILKNIDDLYTQCNIFDYQWNKNRYETDNAETY